jgi:hypothetical protein
MEAHFRKVPSGLIPDTEVDAELLGKIKLGEVVRLSLVRPRNYKFHKKWFALMTLAFDYFEPPEHGEGSAWCEKLSIEKNLDRFRKDITILAGYYNATYRLNGDVRIEAKSIAFGNMGTTEFEKLYSACIDVILKKVCIQMTEDQLRKSVEDMVLDFI